mgnify:CR=1 FL=1
MATNGVPTGIVPTSTEDATAEFLTAALRSTGVIEADSSVAEVEHDRIGEGVGLMLSLIHISEPTRPFTLSRMPSSA